MFSGELQYSTLNDSSGTTRFVCIPVPKKSYPQKGWRDFDQIWSRAMGIRRAINVIRLRGDDLSRKEI